VVKLTDDRVLLGPSSRILYAVFFWFIPIYNMFILLKMLIVYFLYIVYKSQVNISQVKEGILSKRVSLLYVLYNYLFFVYILFNSLCLM